MSDVTFIKSEIDETEYAIIDRGNGEYTSMLKSTYDEQQAQAKEIKPIADEASSK